MYKVILKDGTEIENCLFGTTSDNIMHAGETYAEAASVMDIINEENSGIIKVLDENDNVVTSSNDLVLLPGGKMDKNNDYCVCTVTLRHKTEMEIMQDQIAELQEVVIEG